MTSYYIESDAKLLSYYPGSRGSWTQPAEPPSRTWEIYSIVGEVEDEVPEEVKLECALLVDKDGNDWEVFGTFSVENVEVLDGGDEWILHGYAEVMWEGNTPMQSFAGCE